MNTVIVMAGGTGGHIYPALAVAHALKSSDINVVWMGVRDGLEARVAKESGFEFDAVSVRGIWRSGVTRILTAPFMLTYSMLQCFGIIFRRRPDLLVGMGGFVCGPGGLAAWLLRRPLLIHESNTIPGLTNRLLASLSNRVLTGFENTPLAGKPICVGTPVRTEIIQAANQQDEDEVRESRPLNLLVMGGSQGAKQLNETVPLAIKDLPPESRPRIIHQTGKVDREAVNTTYQELGIHADVREFIDDMAQVYLWADLVIARAGAMTLAEIAILGLAPILVPYPYAARDHQRLNAEYLERNGGAVVLTRQNFSVANLRKELDRLLVDTRLIAQLSKKIHELARPDATDEVIRHCKELMQTRG